MPKTRTTSIMSPTENEIGHRLRSRVNNYLGTTAVDDNQPLKHEGARECRELRSATRQMNQVIKFVNMI